MDCKWNLTQVWIKVVSFVMCLHHVGLVFGRASEKNVDEVMDR